MRDVVNKVILDLDKRITNHTIPVKKDDTLTRTICFTIANSGDVYPLDHVKTAIFKAIKPDGKKIYNDCTIKENEIRYLVTNQTIAVAGTVECELELFDANGGVIGTPQFYLEVYDKLFGDDWIESENEYGGLKDIIKECEEVRSDCLEAAQNIELQKEAIEKTKEEIQDQKNQVNDAIGEINKTIDEFETEMDEFSGEIDHIKEVSDSVDSRLDHIPLFEKRKVNDATEVLIEEGNLATCAQISDIVITEDTTMYSMSDGDALMSRKKGGFNGYFIGSSFHQDEEYQYMIIEPFFIGSEYMIEVGIFEDIQYAYLESYDNILNKITLKSGETLRALEDHIMLYDTSKGTSPLIIQGKTEDIMSLVSVYLIEENINISADSVREWIRFGKGTHEKYIRLSSPASFHLSYGVNDLADEMYNAIADAKYSSDDKKKFELTLSEVYEALVGRGLVFDKEDLDIYADEVRKLPKVNLIFKYNYELGVYDIQSSVALEKDPYFGDSASAKFYVPGRTTVSDSLDSDNLNAVSVDTAITLINDLSESVMVE